MVVDEVKDLDLGAVSQDPEGEVALPELVGQVGFEAEEGGLGALVGLRDD